jgi:prepilin-type N-terminal cleavage/methylation domain-containing protein
MTAVTLTRNQKHRDGGFTMVELVAGIAALAIVSLLVMSSALNAQRVAEGAKANSDLIGDVRLAMERLVRELRQAGTIDDVTLPAGPADPTAITFWADFDNDGARDTDAADPEVLTYRFIPGTAVLTLTVDDADGEAVTTPILAEDVTTFGLELLSSQWQYDRDGDGRVTWAELDATAAPVGNQNGRPDGAELTRIDSVAISVNVARGATNQSYSTHVDFRNRH